MTDTPGFRAVADQVKRIVDDTDSDQRYYKGRDDEYRSTVVASLNDLASMRVGFVPFF